MKSGTKTIVIIILALLLAVSIGLCAFLVFGRKEEKNPSVSIDPGMSDSEVVNYLKDQLSETQKQLTDANILLEGYLKQIEESNKNNQTLTEQNQALNSTIQSLQETVKSLNAEIQRLTALLEEYGNIAEGTCEVHFYDGEDMVRLLLIRNNSKITETVTAEREGFEFKGWATEQGGQVVEYQNIEITQETNFYAVFERITGLFDNQGKRVKTWDELVAQGDIKVSDTTITKVSTALEGALIIPDSFTRIGAEAFKGCERIFKVDGFGITYIGNYAFDGCERLREINYSSESIQFGSFSPFSSCGLKSLVLPKNPVGIDVLWNTNLIEIVNNSTMTNDEVASKTHLSSLEKYDGIHSGESRIIIRDGVRYYVYNDYYIAVGASDFRENIKLVDECNMVWKSAFNMQDQLKHVALNEQFGKDYNITRPLSTDSFSMCTGLEAVWLPMTLIESKTRYGSNCFFNCANATLYTNSSATSYIQYFLKQSTTDEYPGITKYETNFALDEFLSQFGF